MKLNKDEIIDYVNKAKKGDKDAFLKLYLDNINQVYYVCLKLLKNIEEAKDATQETFLTAMEKIMTLKQPESFVTWVNHIAVNKCKNILTRNSQVTFENLDDNNVSVIEEIATEFIPEDYINNKEKRAIIMDIIENKLSDVQRMVIILYYYREESITNIAKILECSEGTVKSRLNSARQIIRKSIEAKEKKGYPILGVAPFILSTIFTEEAKANVIPEDISKTVCQALNIRYNSNLLRLSGGTKEMAKAGLGLKIAGICAGVGVAAAIGVGVAFMGSNDEGEAESTTTYIESESSSDLENITTVVDDTVKEGDILVDNEYCKIVFEGFEIRENGDIYMKVSEQNKTSKKIYVCLADVAVDGIMCDLLNETYIEPNETQEVFTAVTYGITLETAGIDAKNVSMVEFVISIKDKEENKYVHEKKHILYPKGSKNAKKQLYVASADDIVLIDNDICKIVYFNSEVSQYDTFYTNLYIENKTDMDIRFQFGASKVNDVTAPPTHSWPDVTAGNGIYYAPSWWSLEDRGVLPTEVNKVELQILGYSWENFGEAILDETITINP